MRLDFVLWLHLSRRGSRGFHETGGGTGEYVTVLGCGSADGHKLSSYILYTFTNDGN